MKNQKNFSKIYETWKTIQYRFNAIKNKFEAVFKQFFFYYFNRNMYLKSSFLWINKGQIFSQTEGFMFTVLDRIINTKTKFINKEQLARPWRL